MIERDGQTIVITGWRAWLIGAVAAVVVTAVLPPGTVEGGAAVGREVLAVGDSLVDLPTDVVCVAVWKPNRPA